MTNQESEVRVTPEGRILWNEIDVTWNDRALGRLMRAWAQWVLQEGINAE